jgi:hypothetical protein
MRLCWEEDRLRSLELLEVAARMFIRIANDATTYLSSGLSSCLGGIEEGFEPCLKLLPSTTEIGCGMSSEGFSNVACRAMPGVERR